MILDNSSVMIANENEIEEKKFWQKWLFDSHRWIEYKPGYFECSWCLSTWNDKKDETQVEICKQNPHVKPEESKPHTWY